MNSGEEVQDAELITRVRSGDRAAFGELFERHHSAALRAATRFCAGTRISAEDCVSDAFTQIFAALQKGKGPDVFFRAYLYTVMRNAVQSGNKADSESETVDDFEIVERNSKKHNIDPAITRFETKVVRAAFSALPERWQSVLWYSDIEAMKPAEVAPILGLTSHGVSMLRARAREGLRNAYLQAHLSAAPAGGACAGVAAKLGGFVRMTLAARDRTKVETHLTECADCNAMSAEVKNVNRGLLGIIALLFLGDSADDILGALARGGASSSGASVAASVAPRVGSFGLRAGARASMQSPSALKAGATVATAGVGTAMLLGLKSQPKRLVAAGAAGVAATALVILLMVMPGTQGISESSGLTADDSQGETSDVKRPVDDTVFDSGDLVSDDFDSDDVDDRGESADSAVQAGVLPTTFVPSIDPHVEHPLPSAPPVISPVPVEQPVDPPVVPEEPPVAPDEPPAEPVNLLANGGFDGAGYDANNGGFVAGTNLDGWEVGPSTESNPNFHTLKVWFAEMTGAGATKAAPFTHGPWVRVMGTISQSVPTVVGQEYILEYLSRASGSGPGDAAHGWGGGNRSYVSINNERVDMFNAVLDPLYTERSVVFTATSESTLITLGNAGGGAVGFDSISVKIVP